LKHIKQTFITAFALFSLFFGAGNLILPPFLGYNAGTSWGLVTLGFVFSAVIIPILAIYSYAKLQGTMLDFANKVTPVFAIIYSVCVYVISVVLPAPRTASVTYEMAVQPYFQISSFWTSVIYFSLVLVFVLKRNKILNFIGKYLTPLIILILIFIISIGLNTEIDPIKNSVFSNSFTEGILEGYQTFDAIGGVLVGGVVVISLSLQSNYSYLEKKKIIARAGVQSGLGLLFIYGGLIALGAHYNGSFQTDNRTELLTFLSKESLGNIGTAFLGVLVALACFTTAVGIITGTSDFVKGIANNSNIAYTITAIIGSIIGVAIGQFDVHYIINIALPILMFIYPITIVLILLNALPKKWASKIVFKSVVLVTFVFSIPDFLHFLITKENLEFIRSIIPLSENSMGWVLPALLTFVISNLVSKSFQLKEENS